MMSLVFSWRARQAWRRGPSNAATRRQRVSSPSQNSLAALQGWQNCSHKGHREGQERRCRVFAQRWSAGVTPPPLIARTNRKRLLLSPNKCSRIDASPCFACRTRRNKIALERCSSNAENPHCVHTAFCPSRSHQSHVTRLDLFTHHRKKATTFAIRIRISHFDARFIRRRLGHILNCLL